MMTTRADGSGHNGFLFGLITGGVIGAGLAIALAPRLASELRQRATSASADLGHAAAERYQEVSSRVAGAVDSVTVRGQGIRDGVADAIGRSAHEVEQFAMASKTSQTAKRS
jgi:gas vesicle protein